MTSSTTTMTSVARRALVLQRELHLASDRRVHACNTAQSCQRVHFVWPDPTQPISWLTQPNPTHYKWENLDPTRPNPTQPMGQPNPWTTLTQPTCTRIWKVATVMAANGRIAAAQIITSYSPAGNATVHSRPIHASFWSRESFTLCGTVKWVLAYGLSNNNNSGGGCGW